MLKGRTDQFEYQKKIGNEVRKEDINLMNMKAQKEILNEEEYKSKFLRKDEVMKQR